MAAFARSIVIGVAPDVAFSYLADPTMATVFDPAVIHYRPDPAGGRRGRARREWQNEPRRAALTARGCGVRLT